MTKRILVLAGEVSGDLHAAGLIKELQRLRPDLEFLGIGGEQMKACGVKLFYHINQLSFLGFWEVVKHLNFIRQVKKRLLAEMDSDPCHLAVLVDYPGFNLRLAEDLKKRSIPIIYYISPQIWAWGGKRIEKIKKLVEKMIVFFPFEEELYQKHSVNVEFVGHPLAELAKPRLGKREFLERLGLEQECQLIGLFPGSRLQEVRQHLPIMLRAVEIIQATKNEFHFLIGLAPGIEIGFAESMLPANLPVKIVDGYNYDIMAYSELLLVKSGTTTVEASLSGTPFVVMYKVSPLSYLIAKRMVKIPNLAMANILAGRQIVPELIQNEATPERIAREMSGILEDQARYARIKKELGAIRHKLGTGNVYLKAAQNVAEFI